jgi:hypothetical protein
MSGSHKAKEQDVPKEAIIRDHLTKNLSVLEDGLVLRETNVEVQNPDGATGFIDIFAEDNIRSVSSSVHWFGMARHAL